MKPQRWYEIKDGMLFVYDAPYLHTAAACSMTSLSDLQYYRRTFKLAKVWNSAGFQIPESEKSA